MKPDSTTRVTWRHTTWALMAFAWGMLLVYAHDLVGWHRPLVILWDTAVFVSAALDLLVMNNRRQPSARDSVYVLPMALVLVLLLSLSGVLPYCLWPVACTGCVAYVLWSVARRRQ